MYRFCLIIVFSVSGLVQVSGQTSKEIQTRNDLRNLMYNECRKQAKELKMDVHLKGFCNCSFESFYSRLEKSGADLEEVEERVINTILNSEAYLRDMEGCLAQNFKKGRDKTLQQSDYVKQCAKKLKQNKFVRKHTDVELICECHYAKLLDSEYSAEMPKESASELMDKAMEECIIYYLRMSGTYIEPDTD